MNLSKKTILFLMLFSPYCTFIYASNNTIELADDLQKFLSIVPRNSQAQRNSKKLIAIEQSRETESTTYLYANGDYETISYVGSQGIREIYNHQTGQTSRETFNRD